MGITNPMPARDMPSLYKAADAYVLPTWGEGWGRPLMEAIAMGLPTIATNGGSQLDFMYPNGTYLIDVEELLPLKEGQFGQAPRDSQLFMRPSITHLRQLMRQVADDPVRARRHAKVGQAFVRSRFSEHEVARR